MLYYACVLGVINVSFEKNNFICSFGFSTIEVAAQIIRFLMLLCIITFVF